MTINSLKDTLTYWAEAGKRVFKPVEISDIHKDALKQKMIPSKLGFVDFIDLLVTEFEIQTVKLPFPGRTEIRYCFGDYSKYELVISLRQGGYFSHETAAFLHGLIRNEPNNIYLNYEQSPKPPSKGDLTQERIDLAFTNNSRATNNKLSINGYTIYLLNGKYTNQLGVIDLIGSASEKIRVTNIERTLIDIAVRPVYSGGVKQVSNIYKEAGKTLSIDNIIKLLSRLKYVYPYHQAIGFYLDRTGIFSAKDLKPILKIGTTFDFYLDYQIPQKGYSSKWRIYYPNDIDKE